MATELLVPTSVAAVAAGVQPDTIHQWGRRGKLRRHGTSHRRLWDLYELRDLLADTPSPSLHGADRDCQDSEQ